jgi:predicted DCC family thiol-disulfide oxidoreductase YuxK
MMFDKYRTGFDCDCIPEKGPVERLVIYLFKYVSSPPISLRRIEKYDGENVTYWYKDHRRGLVQETISAVEFIGRMIRHLPPKGFRMVRYYGIYARPVRNKVHALVADALKVLVRKAEQIAQRISFLRKIRGDNKGHEHVEHVGGNEEGGVCCPHCGHGKLKLIRIWSKKRGFIYDASAEIGNAQPESSSGVIKQAARRAERSSPQQPACPAQARVNNSVVEQLAFAF